ncbi:MAG: hypothetical protein ACI9DJ_000968 [Algoriphagus sp.]
MQTDEGLQKAVNRACQSKVFKHAISKGFIEKADGNRILHYLEARNVEGLIKAMLPRSVMPTLRFPALKTLQYYSKLQRSLNTYPMPAISI